MAKPGPRQDPEEVAHEWIASATALAECKERKAAAEAMKSGQYERANANRRAAQMLRAAIAKK